MGFSPSPQAGLACLMFPETFRAAAGCLRTTVRELRNTEVSFASTKCKIPIPFGKLPMHERDFRTSYRDSPVKRKGR